MTGDFRSQPGIATGQIWHENDPRIDRDVRVVSVRGEEVRIVRINKDGTRYRGARESIANLSRFGSIARGKYSFVREAKPLPPPPEAI